MSLSKVEGGRPVIGGRERGQGNMDADGEVVRPKVLKDRPRAARGQGGRCEAHVWRGAGASGREIEGGGERVVQDLQVGREEPCVELSSAGIRANLGVPSGVVAIKVPEDKSIRGRGQVRGRESVGWAQGAFSPTKLLKEIT